MTGGGQLSSAALDAADIDGLFAGWMDYPRIALAVSGGADSMSLMVLARGWLARAGRPPHITILTVDHALRPGAAEEAAWVKSQADALGFPHETLVWTGPKPRTDLQATARTARYGLMLDFCAREGIAALATAHTAEDQAETLLMRLARGSGVDGLAAMCPLTMRGGVALLRPLLGISRVRLEATLLAQGVIWIEDPSNYDKRFERVRVREALRSGGALQLTAEKLALSARRLDRARAALDMMARDTLRRALQIHPAGYGELPLAILTQAPEEIGIRAITCLAEMFGGGKRPVRLARIETLYQALTRSDPAAATLGGCVFTPRGERLRIGREFGRIDPNRLPLPENGEILWDGRFSVSVAPASGGLVVGPLGLEGATQLRSAKGRIELPAQIAHSLPALWQGDALVFAPFAIFAQSPPTGWNSNASAVFIGDKRLGCQGRPDRARG
jgi:tRNA(Ile)-lysidine synthase